MIFQHFNLMPSRTVFENIAYPLKGRPKEEIEKKITSPAGAGRPLGQTGCLPLPALRRAEAAGGHRPGFGHRPPSPSLCDEATSALDPQTTTAIPQAAGNRSTGNWG